MLLNYITLAWRNLLRNKTTSILNITGLTIGLTAGALILLFVKQELSYDRFYPGSEDLYRATMEFNMAGNSNHMAITPTPLGPTLKDRYPEVVSYTRIHRAWMPLLFEWEEKKYFESNLVYADSGFYETFGYELLAGDPATALKLPYSLVLTKSLAEKYFGCEEAVGKTVRLNADKTYPVTGLMDDPPANSHLQFDALISFTTMYDQPQYTLDIWTGNINYLTYFRLVPGTDPAAFEIKMNALVTEFTEETMKQMGGFMKTYIQPVSDIHLNPTWRYDLSKSPGSKTYVVVFLAIAFLILLVSAINYTNLATAQSIKRLREVGLRKVVGAQRKSLIFQFLTESVLTALLAFVLSVLLVQSLLPLFGNLLNRDLSQVAVSQPDIFAGFLALALLIGLVSGFYPALYTSGYEPARILKMEMFREGNTRRFRNSLVVLQFFISIALVISTLMVYRQLQFITDKELGFDKDQVVCIPMRHADVRRDYLTVKERLENIPGVVGTAVSQNQLGRSFSFNSFREKSAPEDQVHTVATIDVEADFFDLFGMEIVEGRNFRTEGEEEQKSVVVNQSLVKKMGWEEPIGQQLVYNGTEGYEVIGVVRDFHFTSLKNSLEPVLIPHRKSYYRYLNVRLEPGRISQTLKEIEILWKEIDPDYPLDYVFIDQSFEQLYDQERRLGGIFLYFTVLAILSALLGLYSLVSFSAAQRIREIGIRKAMGSTVYGILGLFSREFFRLVGISALLSIPAVYFFIRNWLNDFAYQAPLTPWPFLAGILIVGFLTLLVVVSRSTQAALTNPADSLRNE